MATYYKSRAVFGGNSSKSLCWQTFPCFFADSPRDMGTRWWEAALLPCNPRIHLCGIHVHWFTPALFSKAHVQAVNHATGVVKILKHFFQLGFTFLTVSCLLISPLFFALAIHHMHSTPSLCWARLWSPWLTGVTFMSLLRVLMSSGSIQSTKAQTFLSLAYMK